VRRWAGALLAIAIVAATAVPAAFGVEELTPEDVAAAEADRRAASRRLADVTAEYEANAGRAESLQDELYQLAMELNVREAELAATRAEATVVVRERYLSGGGGEGLLSLFDASSLSDLTVRSMYLELVTSSDTATLRRLAAVSASYRDQQDLLAAAISEQEQVTAELELLSGRILEELEEANAEYEAVAAAFARQEAERRRLEEEAAGVDTTGAPTTPGGAPATSAAPTEEPPAEEPPAEEPPAEEPPAEAPVEEPPEPAPPASPTDGRTCPVSGASAFVDSWGAPRSGGRRHQGVDMIAPRGTPLVAVEGGAVLRTDDGGLGGISVWLRGDSGDHFYYAHLDALADGLSAGRRLAVGDRLGTVGNTGNARYTTPHLHFELHPGGGGAVNPYPLAAELCL